MKLRNNFLIVLFVVTCAVNNSFALPVSLESELFSYLDSKPEALDVTALKGLVRTRSKDIANAYERYYAAKEDVAIARSALNPFNTGLVLGVSLGATYLWAPLAVNAVLSLPTKFYSIKRNSALRNAQYWYYALAKDKLATEVSKLYYDILTNEFILKSIDLEVSLYNELYDSYASGNDSDKMKEVQETIFGLQLESLTIQDVVIKERASLNTMLSYGPDVELVLAQDSRVLTKISSRRRTHKKILKKARKLSKDYKAKYWMYKAAAKNVRLVRWSIFTIGGFNFSYRQRVRIAKQEKKVARSEKKISYAIVGKKALDSLYQLKTAKKLQDINEEKSVSSLNFSGGVRTNYENEKLTLSDYVMTAVSAIRDYRSFVVSHYHTQGMMQDFFLSLGKEVKYSDDGVLNINNI